MAALGMLRTQQPAVRLGLERALESRLSGETGRKERRKDGRKEGWGEGGKERGKGKGREEGRKGGGGRREERKESGKERKERSEGSRTYTLSLLAPQRGLYHIRSLFKIEYNVHRIKFALLCVQFSEFWKNVLTPM